MDFNKLKLVLNTVKFLRVEQISYRIFYGLRNRLVNKQYNKEINNSIFPLKWENTIIKSKSYLGFGDFCFLNLSHSYKVEIDWNYDAFGKLWIYNLNYFDFLNQSEISKKDALMLINSFIKYDKYLKDGLEPYPTSLRGINWVKYLSKEKIQDSVINKSLYNQYHRLLDNLEYHLLGNHLLENGMSLLFGAFYFKNYKFYKVAKKIIEEELEEQILKDGAHFELSPMYHQIILDRLLDCIYLLQKNTWNKNQEFILYLKEKSEKMLSWLDTVTFSNDAIPMVNDSAYDIAPKTSQILEYAAQLNIFPKNIILSDSGYRTFYNDCYELFLDVGAVGPSYQPGHAHADTFNFILHSKQKPIIIDTGISTYNIGKVREEERATVYHNTVSVNNENSSQVWSGFRVANRAKVEIAQDDSETIVASHNGYKNKGIKHTRSFISNTSGLIITDAINKDLAAVAHFHFHPETELKLNLSENIILVDNITITFEGSISMEKTTYQFANGFNNRLDAEKISISFKNSLKTKIKIES